MIIIPFICLLLVIAWKVMVTLCLIALFPKFFIVAAILLVVVPFVIGFYSGYKE